MNIYAGKDFEVEEIEETSYEGKFKAKLRMTQTGGTELIGEFSEYCSSSDKNNNFVFAIPKTYYNWTAKAVKTEKGKPSFEEVNNPGGCNRYYFQPKFKSNQIYSWNLIHSGATPVPVGNDGKIKFRPWEFFIKDLKMKI